MSPRALALLVLSFLSVTVIAFFVIRILPVPQPDRAGGETTPPVPISQPQVTFRNPARGAASPTVIIVEFADFECVHCRTLASSLEVALRTYPNEVRHVWKNLPNESAHPQAIPAAIAAHCAFEEGKFWDFHDRIYARQGSLSPDAYPTIAAELGMNADRFARCFEGQEPLPLVRRDYEEALSLGLTATPTLFINGERVVGAITTEQLMTYVEKARLDR